MDSRPINPKPNNQEPATMDEEGTQFIGFLNILIQQARDIQNICIYHKQDVYAKVSLTNAKTGTETETGTDSVSTRTINGGGRNPVFNESLRLGVRALDSSIRCEIWMLSRVKNYLQDQLLGLTLIPLSDLLIAKENKLAGEFSLSSNDLFESPCGFVQLSLSYSGSSPDVIPIPSPVQKEQNKEGNKEEVIPEELERIEFPDLELVKENRIMVSEYFGIPCENPPVQSPESLITTEESENPNSQEAGVRVVESFYTENSADSVHGEPDKNCVDSVHSGLDKNNVDLVHGEPDKTNTDSVHSGPVSSVSTTDSHGIEKEKNLSEVCTENEAESSEAVKVKPVKVNEPMISINMEQGNMVDQKEIMDMYMKSMQQFTDSLAKMKLPMDFGNGNNNNGNGSNNNSSTNLSPHSNSSENGSSSTSEKKDGSVKDKNSRVFYGSRAFF
ncbi:hypothetical protein LUZ60_006369 [Juncus effusus]|nr:hypothetical protein LUZ60_006369 [Juncus effusus]